MSGDLRFQQILSPAVKQAVRPGQSLILWYPTGESYTNSLGTPLRIGLGQCVPGRPQDCGWLYTTYKLPAGLSGSVQYAADFPEKLDSDLKTLSTASVVNSLDIEAQQEVYAVSIVQGQSDGFDCRHETSAVTALQAATTADGAIGRVVTAVSFNDASGLVDFLSYGWSADRATKYETQVLTTPYDGIGAAAQSLADNGYIITAFGGNGPDGYILIGTRVSGDSISRPILISPDASTSTQGFSLVGWAVNAPYGSNPSAPVWLYEQ